MSWYWWLLLWVVIAYPFACWAGHWIKGDYDRKDRYWRWKW